MSLPLTKSIKDFSYTDLIVLFIFAFGVAFGSLITLVVCASSFYFLYFLIFTKKRKIPFEAKLIVFVYTIYVVYFFFVSFTYSGLTVAAISMAPNLPILCFAIFCLAFDWDNSHINSKVVGTSATIGVLISIVLVQVVIIVPMDFNINGRHIYNYLMPGQRLAMLSGNPLPYSAILVASASFGFVGYFAKPKFLKILTWVTLLFAGFIILFWSQSRGSQLSFVALLSVVIYFLFWKQILQFLKTHFKVSLAVVFLVLLSIYYIFSGANIVNFEFNSSALVRIYMGYHQFFNLDQIIDKSVMQRIEMYKTAVEAFYDKPIFGYGYENTFEEIRGRNKIFIRKAYTHLHNSFLNHAVAGGLVGLFVFIAFIFLPLAILISFKDWNSKNFLFASLVFTHNFVSGLTNLSMWHDLLVSFNAVLPLVLLLSMVSDKRQREQSRSEESL